MDGHDEGPGGMPDAVTGAVRGPTRPDADGGLRPLPDVPAGGTAGLTTLVGCVGQLFQGDYDLGRQAAERLAAEDLGDGVVVEDLHYGAVAVTQFLEDLAPDTLVLVGAVERDREPGTVQRRWVGRPELDVDEIQTAVRDAGTGYVDVDLVIEVAFGLGALPARTISIEVEPADTDPGEGLSPAAERGLEEALALVRREIALVPVLDLAERLRDEFDRDRLGDTEATDALRALLDELRVLEREGRWGRSFAERDRLELAISEGRIGEGMSHMDWGMWWGLIEELDRLERLDIDGYA